MIIPLFLSSLVFTGAAVRAASMPSKIYGVNLGSWLVLEPWMLPQGWEDMGGQICPSCSDCIMSEWAFGKAYPDTQDEIFQQHWDTWFNQADVDELIENGINTVRIPLGFWLIEQLVDRKTEFYPRGGLAALTRGLRQLKDAGIVAILDHHAPPGVQDANQMFTGNCTSNVQFYTKPNYRRALTWTAVVTALSHLHPDFESVFAIEAVNEPMMDARQTPGYGDFQKKFVTVMRAVEAALGISSSSLQLGLDFQVSSSFSNATQAILDLGNLNTGLFDLDVLTALADAAIILAQISFDSSTAFDIGQSCDGQTPLVANFMDVNWQHNNPSNPAAAKNGPQGYDNHLYYSFGGVADATPTAYMESICNLGRIQADAALGNSPLWFGEWGLPTQFDATDAFLRDFADAQKLAYVQGAGWIFWNFKIEQSVLAGDVSRQWSYSEGVKRKYLTKDPSAYFNPNVCDPYINRTSSST